MGLFDSLFGSGRAREDIYTSSNAAQAALDAARQRAEAALNASKAGSRSDINTGYDQASNILSSAQPTLMDLIKGGYAQGADSLRQGAGGAEQAINDAVSTARNDYTTGYDAAGRTIADTTSRANAALDPYTRAGNAAQTSYDKALGGDASGYGAYRTGFDPYWAYADSLANKNLSARMNAGGVTGGRALTANSRAVSEREGARISDYMAQLANAAARGQQAAGQVSSNTMAGGQQQAGYQSAQGTALGNTAMQGGQQIAGIRSNLGTALNENAVGSGTTQANLGLNLTNAQSGIATGKANALAGIEGNSGSNLANLIYGSGQQNASNIINTGNAVAQTRNGLFSNLASLIGTGIQGATLYNNWGKPTGSLNGGR